MATTDDFFYEGNNTVDQASYVNDQVASQFSGLPGLDDLLRSLDASGRGGSLSARSGASDPYAYADYIVRSMEAAEEAAFDRSQQSAREAMDFEHNEALQYRQWLENMSNTEVQRRMDDLRKAGINPALAYSNPASTPSASQPSGFAATASMQARSTQNITESETLSKRDRDSKMWSTVINALSGIISSGISASAKQASAAILAGA